MKQTVNLNQLKTSNLQMTTHKVIFLWLLVLLMSIGIFLIQKAFHNNLSDAIKSQIEKKNNYSETLHAQAQSQGFQKIISGRENQMNLYRDNQFVLKLVYLLKQISSGLIWEKVSLNHNQIEMQVRGKLVKASLIEISEYMEKLIEFFKPSSVNLIFQPAANDDAIFILNLTVENHE